MLRIAMIGYGNVGKAFAGLLAGRDDMKLYAVSNRSGTVIIDEGCPLDAFPADLKDHPCFITGMTADELIDRGDFDVLVELTPTDLETGEPALSRIRRTLSKGIAVVTGNKGPVVHAYEELAALAEVNRTYFGIGCTTGGALPSIIAGTYGIRGARLLSFEGVLNGTTNYILSEMEDSVVNGQPQSYETVLEKAISEGIAETHPEFDVEGHDTAVKMLILSKVFYSGQGFKPVFLSDVSRKGITDITIDDIRKALAGGERIKLVGRCIPDHENRRLLISVSPETILADHPLFNVHKKNKGLVLHTDTMGDILTSGGASSPTGAAAAILRDILEHVENRWL